MTKDKLFISAFHESSTSFSVSVETLEILYIYKLVKTDTVDLYLDVLIAKPSEPLVECVFDGITYTPTLDIPEIAQFAEWPVIVSGKKVVAGLCSVARYLLKNSTNIEIKSLLGFRDACLMACSESSIWTRFCEIDIIETTKNIIKNKYYKEGRFCLPGDIARFEFHLSKPVRMHNIYKVAREKNKDKDISSQIPIEKLNLNHTFSEGTMMTLADVILYQCYKIFFQLSPFDLLEERLPLTLRWFQVMSASGLPQLEVKVSNPEEEVTVIDEPVFVKQSLYTADPSRYRPEKRVYTKQNDIELAFKLLAPVESVIINKCIPFGIDAAFDWSNVPIEANPNGGALPKKRASRKCEQLENLAKAVIKLASDKEYKIVDFCSGSGHLGILLAVLLPNCEIVLVENKERSLLRAKERIQKLNLPNVTIVQSNLDYFLGSFDIGVALHACGVATDLVIQNCIYRRAHFVVCPCCYGGVKDCHHVTYPRSEQFRKLKLGYKNYLSFAHAADQTHEEDNVKTKQGYFCMDIVDTDRRLQAESYGYNVNLGKLKPNSCTNKNNLLVGVYSKHEGNI
ncbi:glutathione S-transferase, C-terminal domain containing [Leptinotarsa decemlineata]|uniref:glutathione S-transferase, C-terminal domain containing n=1 Tax=Leptinotarsa decemlineata TaxID=7539 RepID=UPI000C2518EC|nr:glutathione S-transferase C-terminal domain-containing protein homolog [Leptinotarsa decemlineata]